jgi:hypothetical protein
MRDHYFQKFDSNSSKSIACFSRRIGARAHMQKWMILIDDDSSRQYLIHIQCRISLLIKLQFVMIKIALAIFAIALASAIPVSNTADDTYYWCGLAEYPKRIFE